MEESLFSQGKRPPNQVSDKEVQLASQIQQLLFPKSCPVCSWCCIGMQNRMARGLGGDYYEFITLHDGCQAVLIGDVTGHGVHASVVMALIYGYIHRSMRDAHNPREPALQVNSFLNYFAERSILLDYLFSTTLFFGIINPKTLEMHYVNAGHVPPLVLRRGEIFTLPPTAQPLGFFRKMELEMGSFLFERGDRFLLYTDGIIEAADAEGNRFGSDRLENLFRAGVSDHQEFLDSIFTALGEFSGPTPPDDDSTAIVIDFHQAEMMCTAPDGTCTGTTPHHR